MLDAKRVAYDRVDLIPALSRLWLRSTGFDAGTVPALRLHSVRVQGSCAIARALDAEWPEPPLFPADPAARARVEAIEAWGDGPLQEAARLIILWAMLHSRDGMLASLEGARLRLPLPAVLAHPLGWPFLRLDAALNGVNATSVQAALESLPNMLERIDEWIEAGDLGQDPPTAADYQLAGSLRLLLTLEDLAPLVAERPAAELALRLIPAFPGRVPAGVLPAAVVPACPPSPNVSLGNQLPDLSALDVDDRTTCRHGSQ
jgi:glutathione S-transferase